MSNHVHVVLHVDVERALGWSNKQVLSLWHTLYKGTLLTQKFMGDEVLSKGELITLHDTIAEYRRRLHDISWLMRNLNKHIAREANKEDNCTGRFWEGRFKSQAWLDESAVLAFVGNPRVNMPKGIAFTLQDYCELVDTTGRMFREDKAGHIDQHQSPILERLGLSAENWLILSTEFEQHFCYAAGAEQMMNNFKIHTQYQRIRGMGKAKVLLCRA
jgi:hypothetical protein